MFHSSPHVPLLEVRSLTVQFGGLKALSDISISLMPGEVVGVIGPNGAGKTTLFNAISGFVKGEGEFYLSGEKRDWLAPHQLIGEGVARTLQGVGLFPNLTAFENVLTAVEQVEKKNFFASALGQRSEAALEYQAHVALENAYCGSLENVMASALSYPDAKRVALARALANNPRILLLDEPAGGLGVQEIDWMKRLIHNIKAHTSIMLVEHHMDVVMDVCDRIYVLNFGQLIAQGTPEEIRNDPQVIASYLGNGAKL